MLTRSQNKAFSITELVMVLGGLGLLATLILPLPQSLRQRERSAACLANLERIGAASLAYAAEDARQQLVPLNMTDVTPLHGAGWGSIWGWRTALPHSFGGQTPTTAFPIGGGLTVMLDSYWGADPNPWGAAARALNPFVEAAGGTLQTYHCPADAGYPVAVTEWTSPDVPASAAGIPCFEMLGNSYRANHAGAVWFQGSDYSVASGSLYVGPSGHSAEYILEPARAVLYSDPMFYTAVRQLSDAEQTDPIVGWHGFLMADNVLYSDGAARLTEIGSLYQFNAQELQDLFLYDTHPSSWLLRRGANWQMDCYPAPGAVIHTYTEPGPPRPYTSQLGWPFERCILNENPFGPGPGGRKAYSPPAEPPNGAWIMR